MNYNERMIHEFLVLYQEEKANEEDLLREENEKYATTTYKKFYQDMADISRTYINEMNRIFNFSGNYSIQTSDDVVAEFRKIIITPEQKKAMNEIRKEPRYRRFMGLNALKNKDALENILNKKLDPYMDFIMEDGGLERTVKDEDKLEKERQDCFDIITSLKDMGSLQETQSSQFLEQIDYIFNYFESMSRGEQIPYKKMSDQEYQKIKDEIGYRGPIDDDLLRNYINDQNELAKYIMLETQTKAKSIENSLN